MIIFAVIGLLLLYLLAVVSVQKEQIKALEEMGLTILKHNAKTNEQADQLQRRVEYLEEQYQKVAIVPGKDLLEALRHKSQFDKGGVTARLEYSEDLMQAIAEQKKEIGQKAARDFYEEVIRKQRRIQEGGKE